MKYLKIFILGAKVAGVDLDEGAIKFGKQYIDELYCGDAHEYLKNVNYDLLILSNVLEHLHNPLDFLLDLYKNIASTHTKLVIDVPNLMGSHSYSNNFNKFLHIAHIWYFTPATLSKLLSLAGFTIDFIFDRGAGMLVICSKLDDLNSNINNQDSSFILSASAINYTNYLTHSKARLAN
jgi:hypothetical protein